MPFYPGAPNAIVPGMSAPGFQYQPPSSILNGASCYLLGVRITAAQPLSENNVVGETPVAKQSSAACFLPPSNVASVVRNVGIELIFSADPGAFNIQVQEADTDADGCYITPAPAAFTVTVAAQIGATANWIARVDLGTIGSRFVRLKTVLNPNAVAIIGKLTLN